MNKAVILPEWREALSKKDKGIRLEVYDCIIEYTLTGSLPEDASERAKDLFELYQPYIDAHISKEEDISNKRRDARIGCTKKQMISNDNKNNNCEQMISNETNDTNIIEYNKNININKNNNIDSISVEKSTPKTKKDCKPDCLEDCMSYFISQGSTAQEAERFFDYFTSNGWKVGGRTAMKDWKASARNWIRNANNYTNNNNQPKQKQNYADRQKQEADRQREWAIANMAKHLPADYTPYQEGDGLGEFDLSNY